MLVYLKEPMGYTQIDGFRVYGEKFAYGSFGSKDVPLSTYKKYEDILEEAEYTQEWLENRYGVEFPPISFKLSEIKKINMDVLSEIAQCVGIDYIKSYRPTLKEKNALCKAIKLAILGEQ